MATPINFNKAPYYDDYQKDKGFLKVLFKPGYPVQSRELNQLQSILQNQVSSIGDHLFKEGSMIVPGGVKVIFADFLRISSIQKVITSATNETSSVITINDVNLVGATFKTSTGMEAVVTAKYVDPINDAQLLSFTYMKGSSTGATEFQPNDVATYSITENNITTTYVITMVDKDITLKTGGVIATSLKGIFYIRGFFVESKDETIVIDPYKSNLSIKVGFSISDKIINAMDDQTLYENSAGFSNLGIEGADRFSVDLSLSFRDSSVKNSDGFLTMVTMVDGEITSVVEKTSYNLISNEIKKYHKDTYGDYIINPFLLTLKEASKYVDSVNGAYFVSQLEMAESEIYTVDYCIHKVKNYAIDILGKDLTLPDNELYFKCTSQQSDLFKSYGFNSGSYYPGKDPNELIIALGSRIKLILDPGSISLEGETLNTKLNSSFYLSKPTDYESKNNVFVPINYGNFIYATECNKLPAIGEKIFFTSSNVALDTISNQYPSLVFNQTRNTINCFDLIGEAYVTGIEFFTGNPGFGWQKTFPNSIALNYWNALAGADFTTLSEKIPGSQGVIDGRFSIAQLDPLYQRGIYKVYITIPKMYTWDEVNTNTKNIVSSVLNAQAYVYDPSVNVDPSLSDISAGTASNTVTDGNAIFNYKTLTGASSDFEFMKTQKVPVEFIRGFFTSFQQSASGSKLEGSRGSVLTKYTYKNDTQPNIEKLHNVLVPKNKMYSDYLHGRIYHQENGMILVKPMYDITTLQMWNTINDGVYEAQTDGSIGPGGIRTNLALLKSYNNRLYTTGDVLAVENFNGLSSSDSGEIEIVSKEIFIDSSNATKMFSTGRKYLKSLKSLSASGLMQSDTSYEITKQYQTKIVSRSNGDVGIQIDTNTDDQFVNFDGKNWTVFLASAGATTYLEAIPVEIVSTSIEYSNSNKTVFFKVYLPGAGSSIPNSQIMDSSSYVGYDIVANMTLFKSLSERTKTRKSKNILSYTVAESYGYTVPAGLDTASMASFLQASQKQYFTKIDLSTADILGINSIYEIALPTPAEKAALVDEYNNPTTDLLYQKIINGKSKDAQGNIVNSYIQLKFATVDDIAFAYNEYRSQVAAAELGKLVDSNGNPTTPTATQITLVTNNYILDNGQRSDMYDLGSISIKPSATYPSGRLFINFDYFEHGAGDYFSIDSYTEGTSLIPKFNNESLADYIDFRPVRSVGTKGYTDNLSCVANRTSLICDAEYYLGKVYKIYAHKDDMSGGIKISTISGKSHPFLPEVPKTPSGSIWLYTVEMKPRVDSLADVIITQNIEKKKKTVDIANLEKRVSNLEYFVTLSSLESETLTKSVTDDNGVERFKTGIFVESFDGHKNSETTNPDYFCSIDSQNGILRPAFTKTSINLDVDRVSSTNVVIKDNLVTLPYVNSLYEAQTWATRTLNITPYNVIEFHPTIKLTPSSDDWMDTTSAPQQVVSQDLTIPGLQEVANRIGVNWGDWKTEWVGVSTNVQQNVSSTSSISPNGWDGSGRLKTTNTTIQTNTTKTTTIEQIRSGQQLAISDKVQTIDLGSSVINVSAIPFIRSRPVGVIVTGFMPNSYLYSYFDKIDMTGYVFPAPYTISTIEYSVFDSLDVSGKTYYAMVGKNRIEFSILHKRYIDKANKLAKIYLNIFAPNDRSIVLPTNTIVMDAATDNKLFTVSSYYTNYVKYVNGTWQAPTQPEQMANNPYYGVAKTDDVGDFVGIFVIPNNNRIKFKTGDRLFEVSNTKILDNATCHIGTMYTAKGTLTTTRDTVLSTRSSVITPMTVSETRDLVSSVTTTTVQNIVTYDQIVPFPPPPPPPPVALSVSTYIDSGRWIHRVTKWSNNTTTDVIIGRDPVAQTFLANSNMSISAVDIFFSTKPKAYNGTNMVTVEIRNTDNGYPGKSVLASSALYPEDVHVDDFARVPTTFTFDTPAHLLKDSEYCIVVKSPATTDYNIYICQTGEPLIGAAGIADKQPVSGILFTSQNDSAWTANQSQDMKYNLYRADYTRSQSVLYVTDKMFDMSNLRTDFDLLDKNQFEIYVPQGGTSQLLKVYHRNHGMFVGDYAELDNLPDTKIGDFSIGNYIDFNKLNGIKLTIVDVSADWYSVEIPPSVIYGKAPTGVISLQTPVKSYKNINYNMAMLNATVISNTDCSVDIEMRTMTGRSLHGSLSLIPYIKQEWVKTSIGKEEYFKVPMLIPSETNRYMKLEASKTNSYDGNGLVYRFYLQSNDGWVSPVIDIERLSTVIVSNYVNNPKKDATTSLVPNFGIVGNLDSGFVESFVEETLPHGGSIMNKYITKPITTPVSNVGLHVYSSYTQTEANQIRYFIRTSLSSDLSVLNTLPWTEITPSLTVGKKSELDTIFESPTEFTCYQIKITLAASNSSSIPIVDDFRCIALGT